MKPQVFLSADEERDLANRYRQGDEKAGQKLARAYLPLVKRIAVKYLKYCDSWEDLVAEGFVGLMKAVRGYDPDQGARLGTYATKWIDAEIREFTMRQSAWLRMGLLAVRTLEPAGEAVSAIGKGLHSKRLIYWRMSGKIRIRFWQMPMNCGRAWRFLKGR